MNAERWQPVSGHLLASAWVGIQTKPRPRPIIIALHDMQDSGWLGSSSFKVAIYVSGNLDRQYSDAVSCFEMSPRPLGDCPSGGDGAITLTCNNWWGDCPLYYWVNVEATDTCAPPSPEPESSPSLPASPPELPPPSNATCDAASLMQDTELFGGALSLDGVPAVQPVDGWEECCATCAELPECKAW